MLKKGLIGVLVCLAQLSG